MPAAPAPLGSLLETQSLQPHPSSTGSESAFTKTSQIIYMHIKLETNSTGGLTPFRPLSGLQEIPVTTREESGVLCFPLEMRPDSPGEYGMQPQIPVAYGEEH